MLLTVEESRIQEALDIFKRIRGKSKATLRTIQSIMGKCNFIATVVRFMELFLRGTALMIMDFNIFVKKRGWNAAGNYEMNVTKRVLIDWDILQVVLRTFHGVDITAPAKYPHAGGEHSQSDASFWGAGYWLQGNYNNVEWKAIGLKLFDSPALEAKGKANVSTSYVEALGLKFLLQNIAPRFIGKFFHVDLDNSGLVSMMIGEKTKSEQVLPIIIDIVSIIVTYAVKPRFNVIRSEQMTYADPLSRFTMPKQGGHYRKLFKERRRQWLRNNATRVLPLEGQPFAPLAKELPKIWAASNRLHASQDPAISNPHYMHSAHIAKKPCLSNACT